MWRVFTYSQPVNQVAPLVQRNNGELDGRFLDGIGVRTDKRWCLILSVPVVLGKGDKRWDAMFLCRENPVMRSTEITDQTPPKGPQGHWISLFDSPFFESMIWERENRRLRGSGDVLLGRDRRRVQDKYPISQKRCVDSV